MNRLIVVPALVAMFALSGCATGTDYAVMGGQAHLDCQGDGSTTVVLMAGMGDDSTTWQPFRDTLGPGVRTCAWDYPGVGESTGTSPMTAGVAAASLNATLAAAGIDDPVVLVGHSIAGLTVRLFVGQHPEDVAGVVLFDPTVSSFAWRYHFSQLAPAWDGAVSSREVDRITAWPDIPFEILRHDSDVYRDQRTWDAEVEDAWKEGQADFAGIAPAGVVYEVPDAGHYVHLDQPQIAADAVLRVLREVE
jgi:pimeloyl-ACP methyl ester carboxylesterase